MMNMSLYLSALINVFNVVPAFLLPVFSNGVQFFFQVLDNDTISRFEEADLSQFTEKTVYQIFDHHLYNLGSPAVYGIDLPSGKYTYGNSRIIADAYFSNLLDFAEYLDFTQSMRDFLKEMGISEEQRTGHGVPAVCADMPGEHLKPNFLSREKQKETMQSKLHQIFLENLQNIIVPPLPSATELAFISDDIAAIVDAEYQQVLSSRMQKKALKNSNPFYSVIFHTQESIYTEIVENTICAICRPDKAFIKTHDIFTFRHFIKSPHTRYIVQYDKTESEIPVGLQIELWDVLFRYTPQNYTPLCRIRRPNCVLWDDRMVVQVCSSICKHTDYSWPGPKRLQRYLMKLGLHIEHPKPSTNDDGSDSVDNCLIELCSIIEETTTIEEADLFWFEIKTLSHNIYAILARNCETGREHFCLKEDSISSDDLINFIVALNHDILGKKVILIRLRSEKFPHLFDERLSNWLSGNEDKCVIHDVYHDIREYYE